MIAFMQHILHYMTENLINILVSSDVHRKSFITWKKYANNNLYKNILLEIAQRSMKK